MENSYRHIWQCLVTGAGPGQSPFTMWQVATNGAQGMPQLRTVVLRGADQAAGTVTFHTDMRSAKVAELRADPRVAMVAVDLVKLLQIRLEGIAEICADDTERKRIWNSARPHTLILYQTALPPGTPIAPPQQASLLARTDIGEITEARENHNGFDNFCVVHVALTKIDYLDISPAGHQRIVFTRSSNWQGNRVAP